MEISIPLNAIIKVEIPTGFLGKSIFRPLLKIHYGTESGETDSVAWYVYNPDKFKTEIVNRTGTNNKAIHTDRIK